jgi:hypothetical protein
MLSILKSQTNDDQTGLGGKCWVVVADRGNKVINIMLSLFCRHIEGRTKNNLHFRLVKQMNGNKRRKLFIIFEISIFIYLLRLVE